MGQKKYHNWFKYLLLTDKEKHIWHTKKDTTILLAKKQILKEILKTSMNLQTIKASLECAIT